MSNASSALSGKRAAIVEDEGMTVMQLSKALRTAGVLVVGSAGNAVAGIDLVLRERPDIVLMDITMPGALNGLDATEAILEQYPVCIVIVSAYNDDEYRSRATALKACGYLVKPVVSQTLIPALERALAEWKPPPL
jgi:two-component system, response regulator PdtaR